MADAKIILKQNEFRFQKQYGQNFLFDTALLEEIVTAAGVTGEDTVLEIGAGAGTLTAQLAKHAKRVLSFEIDESLRPVLAKSLEEFSNTEVRFGDFMQADLVSLEEELGPYKVVANLPYYITTPVLLRFLEQAHHALSLTVMVQKEVADRLTAAPSCKDYGAVTVAVQYAAKVKQLKYVPREAFTPAPNVDSAVVQIEFCGEPMPPKMRKTVKAAFAMRRKTLVNNLMHSFSLSREQAEGLCAALQLPVGVRGENLTTEQFRALSELLPE